MAAVILGMIGVALADHWVVHQVVQDPLARNEQVAPLQRPAYLARRETVAPPQRPAYLARNEHVVPQERPAYLG